MTPDHPIHRLGFNPLGQSLVGLTPEVGRFLEVTR